MGQVHAAFPGLQKLTSHRGHRIKQIDPDIMLA